MTDSLAAQYLLHHAHTDERRLVGRVIDAMRLRLEVGCLRLKNIGHPRLRIPIVERKPRALHLHHHPMTLLETVALLMKVDGKLERRIWHQRLGHRETL